MRTLEGTILDHLSRRVKKLGPHKTVTNKKSLAINNSKSHGYLFRNHTGLINPEDESR